MTNCPVCHMPVDKTTAKAKTTYEDMTYYFCSEECKKKFDQNPKEYAKQPTAAM